MPLLSINPSVFLLRRWKEQRRLSAGHSSAHSGSELVVTYFFCGEEIPYRRLMKTHSLTLGHFKEQLRKKGNYRYGKLGFSIFQRAPVCLESTGLQRDHVSVIKMRCLR